MKRGLQSSMSFISRRTIFYLLYHTLESQNKILFRLIFAIAIFIQNEKIYNKIENNLTTYNQKLSDKIEPDIFSKQIGMCALAISYFNKMDSTALQLIPTVGILQQRQWLKELLSKYEGRGHRTASIT